MNEAKYVKYLDLLKRQEYESLEILLTEDLCKTDSLIQCIKKYVDKTDDNRIKGYTRIQDELYLCNGSSWWIVKNVDSKMLGKLTLLNKCGEYENKFNNIFELINKRRFNWDKSTTKVIYVDQLDVIYKEVKLVNILGSWYAYNNILHFCKVQKTRQLTVCMGNTKLLGLECHEVFIYNSDNVDEIIGMVLPYSV